LLLNGQWRTILDVKVFGDTWLTEKQADARKGRPEGYLYREAKSPDQASGPTGFQWNAM
jgi:hypothetical protein